MATFEKQSIDPQVSQTAGFPWQFRFVMIVIAAGVLGLIAKVLGLF